MAISTSRFVSITSSVAPSVTNSIGGGGIIPPPDPEDNWILAEGTWSDIGIWEDNKFWIDGV